MQLIGDRTAEDDRSREPENEEVESPAWRKPVRLRCSDMAQRDLCAPKRAHGALERSLILFV